MAFSSAKSSVLKLDNSSGTLTDLSAYLNSIDFPETVDSLETTSFGASAKTFIVGLKDATISASGGFDPTLDAHMNGIYGQSATVSFEYGPAGSTTGAPKYAGECIVTSYGVSGAVADLVTVSIELQVTGAVTRSTWA